MLIAPVYARLLKLIAITMFIAAFPAAQALAPAGPNRPPTVPADYVITPFGYFHPSCVVQVADTDVVRRDQKVIQHADGSSDKIHVCAYPHYKADGQEVIGDEQGSAQSNQPPVISHSWVEYASTRTDTSYGYLYAYWNVPAGPSTRHGQTVYLFPGLEDYKGVVTILQPVLGWNADYASAWSIASWNCCVNGNNFEGPPAKANSGDVIYGYIHSTCPIPSISCPTWTIVTRDLTLGTSSQLNSESLGQTFNWAFAGALEVYSVVQCSDYPSDGSAAFYNLGLYDYRWSRINNPTWAITKTSGLDPQCNYGGSLPAQLTLTY